MMPITYQETTEGIDPNDLVGFFFGWPNRPSRADHMKILQGSDLIVLALSKNGRVLGFTTAITDRVSSAFITYIEVLPEWQGKGIGTELMIRMMEKLKTIYAINLICDEDVQGFYEKLGFRESRGMIMRKHQNLHR